MARIKSGVPTVKEIKEGESEYRYISGTGLVLYTRYSNQIYSTKMHAASTPPVMDKKLEIAIDDRVESAAEGGEFIRSDGSVDFTGNQSHGGKNITGVNNLTVTNDAFIKDALDVDGATTLDATAINTTDGVFAVSGANNATITTTGSNDVEITSAQDFNLSITRTCDWDTAVIDWDNSSTFDLTSVGNMTIETSGADTEKKILIQNPNDYVASGGWSGIHIKTDSQGETNVFNGILIECDNIAAKGASYGIDLRSENNIRIRAENANNGNDSTLVMRATGPMDIGVGSSLSAHTANSRVKIHGSNGIDFAVLYRTALDSIIDTTDARFNELDTTKLTRAMTYSTNSTVAYLSDGTCDTQTSAPAYTVSHDSNRNILKGQKVTGAGIPSNTYVGGTVSATAFDLTTSDLSTTVNAEADATNVTLSFFHPTLVEQDNYIGIVNTTNDDNALGTVWKITIYWHHGLTNPNLQIWYCYGTTSSTLDYYKAIEELDGGTTAGILTWTSTSGIIWQNKDTTDAQGIKASALKLQGSADFS